MKRKQLPAYLIQSPGSFSDRKKNRIHLINSPIMAAVEQFTISVPQAKIDQLQRKLAAVDFPDELEDAGRDYGAPLSEVKSLVSYWQTEYDWRKHEKTLNELPNHMTSIEVDGFGDLQIHFLHQQSKVKNAIPLLFCHGCGYCRLAKIG